MATALGKESELIPVLDGHPIAKARHSGYFHLWALGRLRVFPILKRVVTGASDPELRAGAIHGSGDGAKPTTEEQLQLCPWWIATIRDSDASVAGVAAQNVAYFCAKPPELRSALENANWRLDQRRMDNKLTLAIRDIGKNDDLRNEALVLLSAIVRADYLGDEERSFALPRIAELDDAIGRKLAEVYTKGERSMLREMAEAILADTP